MGFASAARSLNRMVAVWGLQTNLRAAQVLTSPCPPSSRQVHDHPNTTVFVIDDNPSLHAAISSASIAYIYTTPSSIAICSTRVRSAPHSFQHTRRPLTPSRRSRRHPRCRTRLPPQVPDGPPSRRAGRARRRTPNTRGRARPGGPVGRAGTTCHHDWPASASQSTERERGLPEATVGQRSHVQLDTARSRVGLKVHTRRTKDKVKD